MTDDLTSKYGLGALPVVPDDRDYSITALYAAEGLAPTAVLPSTYTSSVMPPVLDQDGTPQCVAYSSSTMKSWQDRRDQLTFFNFNEPLFFQQIGGTSQGAYVRAAYERMLNYGYPVVSTGEASLHKIAAYYVVPRDLASLKAAIYDFGPIVVTTPWYQSWFRPVNGVLPRPDVLVGYHAIVAYGWNTTALRLRNSWGSDWGLSGDCYLPNYYISYLNSASKSIDVIEHPVPYVHVVDVIARPSLNVRTAPKTSANRIGSLAYGKDAGTLMLEKYGGKYTANSVDRNDWLQVKYGTKKGWIARGFTRLIR